MSKFKMPAKSDLKGRSSTINNAFAISITPYIRPSEDELEEYYKELKINEGQCAYCLGDGNGRDHLKPLVNNGMPTGYITDIHNLVPCCQKCNSSKGSKDFKSWYNSTENIERLRKLGLSQEQITERYDVICAYESKIPSPIDYESILGSKKWEEYKFRKQKMLDELADNQKFCDDIYQIIQNSLIENKKL